MSTNTQKNNRWKEQYDRVRRWYEKTRTVDFYEKFKDKEYRDDRQILIDLFLHQNSITDEGLDIYYAFFINCFHLKDWLKHSNVLAVDLINDFFHKNEYMKLCHIICTGSKHLVISNEKILDPKAIYGHRVEYDPSRANTENNGDIKTRLIHINTRTYDLMDLSKDCMQAVDNFLYIHNLLDLKKYK